MSTRQINSAPKVTPQPKPYLLTHHRRDLHKSGLSDETIAREGFRSATDTRVWHFLHWPAGPGLLFPFDDGPNGFCRVKLDRPQKDGKQYRQPKDTVNRLYIPKILDRTRLADPSEVLYFTEGEKKAAKLVQEGFCAVACTGVFAWLHDERPIPDLDGIPWEGRCVVIVFDSDPSEQSKGQVRNARRWLTAELTIRGAHVEAVDLPDDGKTKVGIDDYLVAHSVDEFLALPRFSVLGWSVLAPSLIKREKGRAYHVSEAVVSYLASRLGKKSGSNFSAPFRSVLDHGHKADHLTRFVKFKGETRVQVGRSKRAWPLVVVYYNLYRLAQQPKGKYTMVKLPSTWMPIWQALMEVEAGSLEVPEEYRTPLEEAYSALEQQLYDLWRVTLWARRRNPEYASSPGFFEPGMFAMLLGVPKDHVSAAWSFLVMYGIVDNVDDGNLFMIGKAPLDRAEMEAWSDLDSDEVNEVDSPLDPRRSRSQNLTFRGSEGKDTQINQVHHVDARAPSTFIKKGRKNQVHWERQTGSRTPTGKGSEVNHG